MEKNIRIDNNLDQAQNASSLIPVGAIILIAETSFSESEILLERVPCDGRSLNTYTYRRLHSVIGNTYGGTAFQPGITNAPSAITTFNVPNLMNYMTGPLNNSSLGQSGGSKNHYHDSNNQASSSQNTNTDMVNGHAHYLGFNTNAAAGHSDYYGGYATNTGGPNGGAQAKRDGNSPNRIAGIYHGHNGFTIYGFGTNSGASHNHYFTATHGGNSTSSSGGGHSHSFNTSITSSGTGLTEPVYTSLRVYIKA